ncbi:hypothetical protein OH76DRAFT_1482941 [Lentinus brumalis]|uniref:Uncharacterized protein n=1 Tax=Lentinus brumalis TaxID=2498619 RepID=A0A371DAL0_9APHY|nr:hypothetical protein OH76DRAFT_1482941 [Polyporus brumalis]
MRLASILADPESAGMEAPPATQRPRATRGPRYPAASSPPRTRDARTGYEQAAKPKLPRSGASDPHATQGIPRARTVYAPHPTTRAAQHLQAGIEARLAAEARNRLPQAPREQHYPAGREASSAHAAANSEHDATPSHSAMDLDHSSPSRMRTGELRPSPLTEWLRQRSPSRDSRGSGLGRVTPHTHDDSREPEESPDPSADITAPGIALPTVLTAVAPNIDKPMPAPTRATYRVYRDDPEAIIRGVKKAWIEAVWQDPTGTVVLIEVFNFQYTDNVQTVRVVVETLRKFVFVITGEDSMHVVPPELDDERLRGSRDAPRVFAVRGLTPTGAEALLSRCPWSFRAISFFAYRREIGPDTWLLALDGFLDENTQAITSAVRDVLEEPEQWQRLVTLTRGNPAFRGLSGPERADKVLDSITVKTWRLTNGNIVTNVFLIPPTRDTLKYREWTGDLRRRRYGKFINGTGTVRRVSNCMGCNSVEHPTHLCPFQDLPGWNGPRAGAGTYSTLVPPPPPPPPAQQRRREDRRHSAANTDRARAPVTPKKRGGRGGYRN